MHCGSLECQGDRAFVFNVLGYGGPLKAYRHIKTVVLKRKYKIMTYGLEWEETNGNTSIAFQAKGIEGPIVSEMVE